MTKLFLFLTLWGSMATANDFYSFTVKKSDGTNQPLSEYKGKVVLVVNVASKCGYTPQYTGLETLYKKYREKGLVILGFPCNQFGGQEPGTNQEIQKFCQLKYGVDFPVMGKIEVNGSNADPLYSWLKSKAVEKGDIKWNFTKFLVNRKGEVVGRFGSGTTPEELAAPIEKAL